MDSEVQRVPQEQDAVSLEAERKRLVELERLIEDQRLDMAAENLDDVEPGEDAHDDAEDRQQAAQLVQPEVLQAEEEGFEEEV